MKKLYAKQTIYDIKQTHNFNLSKSLGQNFLTDKNTIDNIVEGSQVCENDLVIEIGPGMGVITAELAQVAKRVVAIEIDKKLIPILEDTLEEFKNIEIKNADVLQVNFDEIVAEQKAQYGEFEHIRIVGNLPYYITTPIIMKILEDGAKVDSITVMMQKEVADRIMANPSTKARGALSVAVQYYCNIEKVTDVSKNVFVPVPKVDSTVLQLTLHKQKIVDLNDDKLFFKVIKSGFGQRRKTLLNSLSAGLMKSKDEISAILASVEINSMRRAETLTIDEFADIANALATK